MIATGDMAAFMAAVSEIRKRLAELDPDASLGLVKRLNILLKELPADLFVSQPVGAFWTGDLSVPPAVVIGPGPRLDVLASALRAPDVDTKLHELPLPALAPSKEALGALPKRLGLR